MSAGTVRIAIDANDQLGEGPVWDERAQRLLRVDIPRGLVHEWDPVTGETETTAYDGLVSAVLPRKRDPGRVVAITHRLVLDEPGGQRVLAAVEVDDPDTRFNDCRIDPQGRLWAGTMSMSKREGAGTLYRVSPGAGMIERIVRRVTISNGIGWSPDGETMYYVDSPTQRLDAFDFDAAAGTVDGRRTLATIDPADGMPDGLAVDAEGGIWLALWHGGAVRRYSPAGALEAHVDVPASKTTCPAFGGPALDTLYVTSARASDEPHGGHVFAFQPGVAGLPANAYAG